tara:strand:+ start:1396 stop:1602 length:207 start_codon:yes stop_codon:yes gene_type:complete
MKTFEIHYEFRMAGYAEVEAESLDKAIEKFENPDPGEEGLHGVAYQDGCDPGSAYDERVVTEDCREVK